MGPEPLQRQLPPARPPGPVGRTRASSPARARPLRSATMDWASPQAPPPNLARPDALPRSPASEGRLRLREASGRRVNPGPRRFRWTDPGVPCPTASSAFRAPGGHLGCRSTQLCERRAAPLHPASTGRSARPLPGGARPCGMLHTGAGVRRGPPLRGARWRPRAGGPRASGRSRRQPPAPRARAMRPPLGWRRGGPPPRACRPPRARSPRGTHQRRRRPRQGAGTRGRRSPRLPHPFYRTLPSVPASGSRLGRPDGVGTRAAHRSTDRGEEPPPERRRGEELGRASEIHR